MKIMSGGTDIYIRVFCAINIQMAKDTLYMYVACVAGV
jgi:hypothetical protein